MRRRLTASLSATIDSPADPLARPIRREDVDALASLMLDAYRGTIDDGGESLEDAVSEVRKLLDGAYGAFDFAASELIERDGRPVSATVVTHYEGVPLIAFSMTAPTWKRRGLAKAGLQRAMARLAGAGVPRVDLVVTAGNTPAETLYERLGFVPAA